MFMKIVKVATHDGVFHADEVFALAVLKLCMEKEDTKIEIIRTRNMEIISSCDMAVDVGSEYNNVKRKYDHHQIDKPATRKNGIPYASFGLIWKHFGCQLTSNKDVWEAIEQKLVLPIDALDNGVSISVPVFKDIYEFSIAQVISSISMFYSEDQDIAFGKAVEFAMMIVVGEIRKAENKIEGEEIVTKEIKNQGEPKMLILDKYISWEVAVSKFKNVKLVIFPDKRPDRWCIQAARDDLEIFNQDRISFPKDWRGLADEELTATSGISGSVFCHTGGFFAVTKTKQSAINFAFKAISLFE